MSQRTRLGTLLVLACLAAWSCLQSASSARDQPYVRLTRDGRSSFDHWNMAAPVTGRIAFRRLVGESKKQLTVADADGGNPAAVDQVGAPDGETWSPDGQRLVYTWQAGTSGDPERAVRVWEAATGRTRTLTKGTASYRAFTWSPNRRYLAAQKSLLGSARTMLSIFDLETGREVRLAANHYQAGGWQYALCWSADGSQVCFVSQESEGDTTGLWTCRVDGTRLGRLTPRDYIVLPPFWPRGGEWILFSASMAETEYEWAYDLYAVRPTGEGLHLITGDAQKDTRGRHSFLLQAVTEDGQYAVAQHYYPTHSLYELDWPYVDTATGKWTHAVGPDVASRRRQVGGTLWGLSPDGKKLVASWTESEFHNFESDEATPGTTWCAAAVFDVATGERRELARFERGASPLDLTGWPGLSSDGRRVYLTVQKVISAAEGRYEPDLVAVDLGQAPEQQNSSPPAAAALPASPPPAAAAAQPAVLAPLPAGDGTVRLRVMNISAAEALSLLPDGYQPFVKADAGRSSLLVTAPPEAVNAIERALRSVDAAAPQIAVEVLVIELSQQGARDLGVDVTYSKGHWAALTPVGQTSRLGPTSAEGIPLLPSHPGGLGEIIFQGVGELPDTFFAHLQALETSGDARIEASPTVVATSGKEATITVRQRVNFFYTTGYDISGRPTLAKSDISADINMKILPTVLGNGKVLLEVDALVGSFTFKGSGALPDTTDRQVATSLTVGDGQTVVLGGLKQHQSTVVRQRVPLLGSLPLIGGLFRHASRTSTENTLTVLITLRVAEPERSAADRDDRGFPAAAPRP